MDQPRVLSRAAMSAAGGIVLVAGFVARGAPGDIYDLGTLGSSGAFPCSMNEARQVAGYAYADVFAPHAFRYDGMPGAGGVMRDLGTLGGTRSYAFGINNLGQVAGYAHQLWDWPRRAFRYDGTPGVGGVMRDLGTLGGTHSHGWAINDAGQVAGYSDIEENAGEHAFRYDGTPGIDGVMHDLGTLGGTHSSAHAINASGQVTGGSGRAFRYDGTPGAGGVMHDLGELVPSYGAVGYAINALGQVAGVAWTEFGFRGFSYEGTPGAGGAMRALSTLGIERSWAWGINDFGFIVGTSLSPMTGGSLAVLWRRDLSIVNLDAWLDEVNPTAGKSWTLEVARDITEDGWITGYGYHPGPDGQPLYGGGFILDASSLIPEPSVVSVILTCVLARRRRHREG